MLERDYCLAWFVAALLDDIALNTPWGGQSDWPRQPLVTGLSGDVDAGTRFFDRFGFFRCAAAGALAAAGAVTSDTSATPCTAGGAVPSHTLRAARYKSIASLKRPNER